MGRSNGQKRRSREERAVQRGRVYGNWCDGITATVILIGGILTLFVGSPRPGLQIIATTIWLGLAAHCWEVFYSGEFRVRNLLKLTRAETPRPFYLLATLQTAIYLAFATFLWLLIYVTDPPR
jgi:hypothetical protein